MPPRSKKSKKADATITPASEFQLVPFAVELDVSSPATMSAFMASNNPDHILTQLCTELVKQTPDYAVLRELLRTCQLQTCSDSLIETTNPVAYELSKLQLFYIDRKLPAADVSNNVYMCGVCFGDATPAPDSDEVHIVN